MQRSNGRKEAVDRQLDLLDLLVNWALSVSLFHTHAAEISKSHESLVMLLNDAYGV